MAELIPVVANITTNQHEPLNFPSNTVGLPLVDAGNYFPIKKVEEALQHLAGGGGTYATSLVAGVVRIALGAEFPIHADDLKAATPAYVKAAIDSIAHDPVVLSPADASVTITPSGPQSFSIKANLPTASGSGAGLVSLSVMASYPANQNNDTTASTPAFAKALAQAEVASEAAARTVADNALQTAITNEANNRFIQDGLKADKSILVTGAGLATGGGALSANQTITVTPATVGETAAMVRNDVAITPAALTQFRADLYNAILAAPPAVLDTLQEIAAALGNDPNFATTITALIGTKAPLARNLTAAGLVTGGGDLSADRTFTVTAATAAETAAMALSNVAVTPASLSTLLGTKPPTTRNLTAAGLVTGGGDLSANRTFTVTAATLAEANARVRNDVAITPASLPAFPAGFTVVPVSVV